MKPDTIPSIPVLKKGVPEIQRLLLLCSLLLASSPLVNAQTITTGVPGFISYQGRVLNNTGGLVGAGTPVNRTVIFRIWDHPSNTLTGNLMYSEQQTVTISDGEFSVLVGQGVATSGSQFGYSETAKKLADIATAFAGSGRYLGVTVDDGTAAVDNEITPRQQVVSSAFSFRAKFAETLGTSASTALTVVDSGNIGMGNTNPPARLTVTAAGTGTGSPQMIVTADDVTERLRIGVDSNGNGTGYLQAFKEGTGAQNLLLNPSGGRVGIGTTTPATILDVRGATVTNKGQLSLVDTANSSSSVASMAQLTGWGNNIGVDTTATGRLWAVGSLNGSSHDVVLWNDQNAPVLLATNGAERVRVTGDGNVGIGVNPSYLLHVQTPGAQTGRIHVGGLGANGDEKIVSFGDGALVYVGEKGADDTMELRASRFYFNNGWVGIGVPAATSSLEIAGGVRARGGVPGGSGVNNNGYAFNGNSGDSDSGMFSSADGVLQFHVDSIERVRINSNGNVGIGTNSPTRAKLDINGSANTTIGTNGYFYITGVIANVGGGTMNASIYASNDVLGGVFRAFSDARIKDIAGISNGARDLDILSRIEVTDFTYRDQISKGAGLQKKLIAQQVEAVYPQAVTKTTDVIPDIYTKAAITEGWVDLETALAVGDRVKLLTKTHEGIYAVEEVRPGGFRTSFRTSEDTVFVYGREVDDFRTVDYEAVAMLNVSATQEVNRRAEEQKKQIAALKKRVAELEALEQARSVREKVRDAKLAKIEKMLLSAEKPAALPVSLKRGGEAE